MPRTKKDEVRFTLALQPELAQALDEHCDKQSKRAASVIGTPYRVSRNQAIVAILRRAFSLPDPEA